jgi:membrane associated rhomboid family serine protease
MATIPPMIITYVLIGITVVVSMYAFNQPEIMKKLILNPYVVKSRGEYYRFLTSGFLHKDHMHLIFNMITLYFFGQIIETVFFAIFGSKGAIYYVLLYLLAIVVSDIPSYFKYRHSPGYNSLGASGGVSAIVFAFILFLPLEDISIYFFIPIKGFILGILYLIYSYYQGRKGGDNINHDAHLYGALFGLIYCVVMYPPSVQNFIDQIRNWRVF